MSLVIECWQSLHSTRRSIMTAVPAGMSFAFVTYEGAIPHDAITDWCRWHGLEYETGELVIETIQLLDRDRTERIQSEINLKS